MKRPNQKDYKIYVVDGADTVHLFDFRYWDYIDELEKYCDYIETVAKRNEETLKKLVKALLEKGKL